MASVKIPYDTEQFLVHRYGENWNTPDSEFNQKGNGKNLMLESYYL